MASVIVKTALGPIEVADEGTGPALLVLHGMPGDYRQAAPLADDLRGEARVLRVSRPGYGRTPLSSGKSPSQQAALYAALLDSLGISSAIVIGISGGGPSAFAFASSHPTRCAGLLLCCAVAAPVIEAPMGMVRLARVPGLWRTLAFVARAVARVRPPAQPSDDDARPVEREQLSDPRVRLALEEFTRNSPTWMSGVGLRNDTRQILSSGPLVWSGGAVPTVVMHGDADSVVALASAHAYAQAIPGASLEVLEGYGHAVPLFARDLVNERLRGLLH